MNCRDQIIYATLLHDIGKFMQRADLPCPGLTDDASKQRVCPQDKQSGRFTHLHTLWTDQFFEEHGSLFPDLTERFPNAEDNLTNLAAWHHVPSTAAQWIVTEAERMSSGMDRKARDEEDEIGPGAYKSTPLRSLFARVDLRLDRGPLPEGHWEYPLKSLRAERVAIFPVLQSDGPKSLVEDYKTLWAQFESELKSLSNFRTQYSLFFNRLLWLWQKYAWCVPSSAIDLPDISLYDHSRTAAGIAACLYDYHRATDTFDDDAIKKRDTEKFRILAGDVSGIQRALFAFAPTRSKGAAKTLRARSFYLSMLGEAAIQIVLDRLKASPTQVLMNAGGRFLVLLPNLPELEPELNEIRQISDLWCRDQFNGLLTLNLDWSVTLRSWDFYLGEHQPYTPADRRTFATVLEQITQSLEQQKRRKLAAALIRNGKWCESTEFLLTARYQRYQQNGKCEACGEEPADDIVEDGMKIGANCRTMRGLGKDLVADPVLVWDERNPTLSFFEGRVGIRLIPVERLIGVGERVEELNSDDQGFCCRFMANYVPRLKDGQKERLQNRCDDEDLNDLEIGDVLSLGCIAAEARHQDKDSFVGVNFLGLLKGDVDYLGQIFSRGFGADFSVSRYTTLSRMLDLFFSGYLNTIMQEKDYSNTYTVYAGGDDFFLISDWETALGLADRLEQDFSAYTCYNPNITLSSGLALTKPRYPVRLGANQADDNLKDAKDNGRARLSIFGCTVEWKVFRENLKPYFNVLNDAIGRGDFGTGFLYRLLKYHSMHLEVSKKPQRALYRSLMSYDLKRNIEKRKDGRVLNQPILDQLSRLFDMRAQDKTLMDNLSIPAQWALYRNRKGG